MDVQSVRSFRVIVGEVRETTAGATTYWECDIAVNDDANDGMVIHIRQENRKQLEDGEWEHDKQHALFLQLAALKGSEATVTVRNRFERKMDPVTGEYTLRAIVAHFKPTEVTIAE